MLHIVRDIITGVMMISVIRTSAALAANKTKMSESSLLSEKRISELLKFDDEMANSFRDFSGSQNTSGWNYGYIQRDKQTARGDMIGNVCLMETYENGWWKSRVSNFAAVSA